MSDFRIGKMDAYSWDRDILRDILHFVIVYKVKHDGLTPSLREIADRYPGMSSSTASRFLAELADAGELTPIERSGRIVSYRVPGWRWGHD